MYRLCNHKKTTIQMVITDRGTLGVVQSGRFSFNIEQICGYSAIRKLKYCWCISVGGVCGQGDPIILRTTCLSTTTNQSRNCTTCRNKWEILEVGRLNSGTEDTIGWRKLETIIRGCRVALSINTHVQDLIMSVQTRDANLYFVLRRSKFHKYGC